MRTSNTGRLLTHLCHNLTSCRTNYRGIHRALHRGFPLNFHYSNVEQVRTSSNQSFRAMSQDSKSGANGAKPSIELTDLEARLRLLLLDVAAHINPAKPSELRFTGGWVRDKLLGTGSKDIDVAINDMTGYNFGLKMEEYLSLLENSKKHGFTSTAADGGTSNTSKELLGSLHKIEANPEKSKHLETVTTRVFGLDIDLVNLRKETYTDLSRNPQMEFGTPEEDALRRDATINALFFNLQTNEVEDFTRQGLEDLKNGIIRTPLEPFQTFKDDPLRVLRLIRFASRLQFQIDPSTSESMKESAIREALRVKISRERVGDEVEKMLRGAKDRNAHTSLDLINRIDLYSTIFTDPTREIDYQPEIDWFRKAFDCVFQIVESHEYLSQLIAPNGEARYHLWLLSALVPWADAPTAAPKSGKKLPPSLACNVAREGIKAPNKVCDIVDSSVGHVDDIIRVKDRCVRRLNGQTSPELVNAEARDVIGMAIRQWGSTWKLQTAFAMMVETARLSSTKTDVFASYEMFFKHVESLELLEAYDFKPVVDGKTLSQALDIKPGPWMKDALDVVMAWQLRHPDSATKEGAIEAVKKKNGELTASLLEHFLQLTLRPLFSKIQTHNVTPAGHRRTVGQTKSFELDESLEKHPWKKEANGFALDLLEWVLRSLSPQLTEKHWPLLVPPVFALLDDLDSNYKAKGCNMVYLLLQQTPPALLKRTGLGKVFEDAISPCLTYLPGLTPEHESSMLLNAAFPAILKLYAVQYPPETHTVDSALSSRLSERYIRAVQALLHETVIPSIGHVSDSHPKISTILVQQMGEVINQIGIHSVSHLKDTLSILTSLISDPYATASPAMIAACVETQQLVIANAWPRVYFWRTEIMKGICTLWVRISEDEQDLPEKAPAERKQSLAQIKEKLVQNAKMLLNAIEGSKALTEEDNDVTDRDEIVAADFRADFRIIAGVDERLRELCRAVFD